MFARPAMYQLLLNHTTCLLSSLLLSCNGHFALALEPYPGPDHAHAKMIISVRITNYIIGYEVS